MQTARKHRKVLQLLPHIEEALLSVPKLNTVSVHARVSNQIH